VHHVREEIAERFTGTRDSCHARSIGQRLCQPSVARGVHNGTDMCHCKVCVSERLFLRILALLVA
jgi:hypothetical protein